MQVFVPYFNNFRYIYTNKKNFNAFILDVYVDAIVSVSVRFFNTPMHALKVKIQDCRCESSFSEMNQTQGEILKMDKEILTKFHKFFRLGQDIIVVC